jgi:hypothetical protein
MIVDFEDNYDTVTKMWDFTWKFVKTVSVYFYNICVRAQLENRVST